MSHDIDELLLALSTEDAPDTSCRVWTSSLNVSVIFARTNSLAVVYCPPFLYRLRTAKLKALGQIIAAVGSHLSSTSQHCVSRVHFVNESQSMIQLVCQFVTFLV